jgi:hypothetical protein
VSERLKSLVTDELFTVEEKGVAPVRGRTPMGIIINSNHDAPLVVAQGDRRWAVLQAVAQENVASPAYFSQLHAEIDDDVSLPAFAKFLLNRDIASFKPHGPPPMTDAKQVAISASRTPLAQILKESIELELGPFYREVVSPEEVLAHLERSPYDHGKVGPQKLAQALRSCGAVQLEKTRRVGLPSVRPWAIRNPAKWVAATPDAVRAELTRQLVPMAGVHVLRPDRPPVPYPHVGEEAAKA